MSENPTSSRRPYRSVRRTQQAAQTRDDVIAAAISAFAESGWAGTTMGALAERAGVAVETIYSGVGSKKAVLRAAMEAAVVGDAAPVPMASRAEWAALGQGVRRERWARGMDLLVDIHARSAGVWRAVVEAAAGDADVETWRVELEETRRVGVHDALALILGREVDVDTVDLVWALWGPEVYLKLVGDRGLPVERYKAAMQRGASAIVRSGTT